jgi:hypothetical protein
MGHGLTGGEGGIDSMVTQRTGSFRKPSQCTLGKLGGRTLDKSLTLAFKNKGLVYRHTDSAKEASEVGVRALGRQVAEEEHGGRRVHLGAFFGGRRGRIKGGVVVRINRSLHVSRTVTRARRNRKIKRNTK